MKVFISHSSEQTALARRVGKALRDSGFEVWNEAVDILPGDNWAEKTAQALKEAEAMVVLLTPDALDSTSVRHEINFALAGEQFNQRLIPVLVGIDEASSLAKVPWILRHLNTIRLPAVGRQDEAIDRIAKALQAVA